MDKNAKLITNKEELRSHIHGIHNYMRNNGVGYGFDALDTFNLLYGLKILEPYLGKGNFDKVLLKEIKDKNKNMTKEELNDELEKLKEALNFSNLIKMAEKAKDDELYQELDDEVCERLYHSKNLKEIFYYPIPQNLKAEVIRNITLKINQINTEGNHHLAGKVYEYFIGRDENAISSLGAYFTDRLITNFVIKKLIVNGVKFINDDNTVKRFCDPFGGSGGFTLSFIQYVNEIVKNKKIELDWQKEIKKIHHFDLSAKVIKMVKLELFTLTHALVNSKSDQIEKTNSFTHDYDKLFDIILSNPPYGGDKCEKTSEQKKIEKELNWICDKLKEIYAELEIDITGKSGQEDTKSKLIAKKYKDEIKSLQKNTKDKEKKNNCNLALSLIEQYNELNEKYKEIDTEQKNRCVNYDTCKASNKNGIIRDFIEKYKKMYNEKYKSKDKRYENYNFGDCMDTRYANDKEACSLILLMALLEKEGTCGAVLKEGVFFDSKYSFLREILIEYFNVTHVISVPSNQFENTTTKTSIIIFSNPINEKDTTKYVQFSEIIVNHEEEDVYELIDNKVYLTRNKDDIKDEEHAITEKLLVKVKKEDISKPTVTQNKKKEDILTYNYYLNWKNYENNEVYCPEGFELKKIGELCEINPPNEIKIPVPKDMSKMKPLITKLHDTHMDLTKLRELIIIREQKPLY